jgi:hypothetical protein
MLLYPPGVSQPKNSSVQLQTMAPPVTCSCALQNERGISPLGVAVGFNRKDMVQLLLDAGADLAARDGQGNTVLHYAAGEGVLLLGEDCVACLCGVRAGQGC